MASLKKGDKLPIFTAQLDNGKTLSSEDLLGKNTVIFFYPKDNTRVCTAEACSFRDEYSEFQSLNAEVIGISSDSEQSHLGFRSKHGLQYPLISDKGGELRKAFGVPKKLGLIPGRVTYVINAEGLVHSVFDSFFESEGHIEAAKSALKQLQEENA